MQIVLLIFNFKTLSNRGEKKVCQINKITIHFIIASQSEESISTKEVYPLLSNRQYK